MYQSQLKKRFIIGSANFSQNYGADSTRVSEKQIKKILDLAKKNKIYKVDTAEAYLKQKNIFSKVDSKFKFIYKVNPNKNWLSLEFSQKKLEYFLNNVNNNKLDTILFHDTKILFKKEGMKIFDNLESLKKQKYFNKIGISIYDMDDLDYIISNYNIDIVQCPYNILDNRILITGWFDKLKKIGIETHIRSIFLQGLLVNKNVYKKKFFKKWYNALHQWFSLIQENDISPIDYCLSDILKYDFDRIIIGINSYDNFKEILNFKKIDNDDKLNIKTNDIKLIDPRNWK